jgi:phage terminase large subunit-like protein
MAGTSIARARQRSAQLAARRVPKRTSAEVAVSPRIARAREDFTAFCIAMGKPPAPHMLEWHAELVTGESNEHLLDVAGPNTCLLSPRGPLDLDTPVATPSGWQPLREIRKGQWVYTSGGYLAQVTGRVRYGKAPCWEVVLSDGTSQVCDDSHRWRVRRAVNTDKIGSPWRDTTLEQLRIGAAGTGGDPERPWLTPSGRPRWQAPVTAPVERQPAELPIDPYLLGTLISRGSTVNNCVRFTCADPDVLDRVREVLPEGCELAGVSAATTAWSMRGAVGRGALGGKPRNPLMPLLQEANLWNVRARDRCLPGDYLLGSIAQRVALLQGLLDTAGSSRRGGTITYVARSWHVATAVLELARSLGGLARKAPAVMRRKGLVYPVNLTLPAEIDPFHCTAKAAAYRGHLAARRPGALTRTIVDIRPAGTREIGCITVDDERHDFLIQDYVVSCNSAKSTEIGLLCAWLVGRHALAKRLLRILYVSYNIDVARGKSLAIKNTLLSLDYQEIFPMVRLSKTRTSDELWSIDYDFAGIDVRGEDAFTLACAGLRGTIASKRSNFIVLDDLIKSKQAIANPDVRREMEGNWNSVIVPTMFQGARAVALGTRFHFDDMFATTFTEKKGWRVITQAALLYDDEGRARSYWPEMWSLAYLMGLQKQDRVAFAYQYMNQAVRATELGVSPELFIKGQIPESFDEIGVGIDLSSGMGERNDYTVFMLGGRDGDKAYIIDKRRLRCMGNIEKIEAMCDLLHEWNLLGRDETGRYQPTFSEVVIWPEEVAYQKSFQGDFKRIVYEEWGLSNLRIKPVSGIRGDKLARFRGVIGLFETQRVIFNKYRDFQVVFDEVMNLGHAPHDDCADAAQILLHQLFRRGSVEVDWSS